MILTFGKKGTSHMTKTDLSNQRDVCRSFFIGYLTKPSIAFNSRMTHELEESDHSLRNYPSIYLEEPSKNTKDLSQDSQCPDQDRNCAPTEYKSTVGSL
jgi:hypothetical protein